MRREFTAIGETVNLCQRIEQLTKKCGGRSSSATGRGNDWSGNGRSIASGRRI